MLKASIAIVISLISWTSGGKIYPKEENAYDSNVTTLYPINATFGDITSKITPNDFNDTKSNGSETFDKSDSASEEEKVTNNERIEINKVLNEEINNIDNQNVDDIHNDIAKNTDADSVSKETIAKERKTVDIKKEVTAWSIDTAFSPNKDLSNNTKEDENKTRNNKLKDFKPSPLLGTFYEEESFIVPTQSSVTPFTPVNKKPPSTISASQDYYKLNYKKPIDTPYPFERHVYTKTKHWKDTLDSKPTVEVPVRIPAGGLYKSPYLLEEKPELETYGHGFNHFGDVKEITVKERSNPWKSLLNLATALLPIGIIISALTPNIVTLQTTENDPYHPTRITRYSESNISELPTISERCKRRLLCEIHSDRNYLRYENIPSQGFKYCYKLQCEDPQAMNKVLQWLLAHHRYGSYQQVPADDGRFITT